MTERPSAWRRIEGALRAFADVRPGEGPTLALLALNGFLLLMAYYFVKPVREAWILGGSGAEVKSYAAVGQVALLTVVVPLYARLASGFTRRRLIFTVNGSFALCFLAFAALASVEIVFDVGFYLFVGLFSLMVVAQFWSLANDVYSPGQGERLFALVAFGTSSGAVAGSWVAGRSFEALGEVPLLLAASGTLLLSLFLTGMVDDREGVAGGHSAESEEPLPPGGAYELLFRDRYLIQIALLVLFFGWIGSNGEYILGRIVTEAAREAVATGSAVSVGRFVGNFYANFYMVVNAAGLAIQLLLVSRLVRWLGVRLAVAALPALALGVYATLFLVPVLAVVRWMKTAENATAYSLQNTVRNALFLPLGREEKYKAKQAIDTLFVRLGDVLSAGAVLLGTKVFAFGIEGFAALNFGLVGIWLAVSVGVGREYSRRTASLRNAA